MGLFDLDNLFNPSPTADKPANGNTNVKVSVAQNGQSDPAGAASPSSQGQSQSGTAFASGGLAPLVDTPTKQPQVTPQFQPTQTSATQTPDPIASPITSTPKVATTDSSKVNAQSQTTLVTSTTPTTPSPTATPNLTPTPTTPPTSTVMLTSTVQPTPVEPTPSATPRLETDLKDNSHQSSFMQNKPLAGVTFAGIGIIAVVLLILTITHFVRRRSRAKLLDEAGLFKDPTLYLNRGSLDSGGMVKSDGASSGHGHGVGSDGTIRYPAVAYSQPQASNMYQSPFAQPPQTYLNQQAFYSHQQPYVAAPLIFQNYGVELPHEHGPVMYESETNGPVIDHSPPQSETDFEHSGSQRQERHPPTVRNSLAGLSISNYSEPPPDYGGQDGLGVHDNVGNQSVHNEVLVTSKSVSNSPHPSRAHAGSPHSMKLLGSSSTNDAYDGIDEPEDRGQLKVANQ